jgi:hypothetical protein
MKLQLTAGELNAFETLLGFIGGVGSYLSSHLASFPMVDQGIIGVIGLALGYFAADALAEEQGKPVTAATVEGQVANLYTPAIQAQLKAKIVATVTDPAQQQIALAVLAEVDLALASAPPVSPLAQAVAASKATP